MDAPYLYVVKFWVHPDGAATILHWLDEKHMAEVTAQPGFQWSRRVRLDEDADDGWHAYMMIYGLESRDALMRYFESDAPKQYASRAQAVRAPSAHRACAGARSIFASTDGGWHGGTHRSRALGKPAREILQHRAAA